MQICERACNLLKHQNNYNAYDFGRINICQTDANRLICKWDIYALLRKNTTCVWREKLLIDKYANIQVDINFNMRVIFS